MGYSYLGINIFKTFFNLEGGGLRSLRKVRKEQSIWRDSKPLERQVVLKCRPYKENASDLGARH